MKVYLIVFSPECSSGTYMFAETLEFVNDAHIKVSGYFVFNDDVKEYLKLKK